MRQDSLISYSTSLLFFNGPFFHTDVGLVVYADLPGQIGICQFFMNCDIFLQRYCTLFPYILHALLVILESGSNHIIDSKFGSLQSMHRILVISAKIISPSTPDSTLEWVCQGRYDLFSRCAFTL